jgi:hypothetical protein
LQQSVPSKHRPTGVGGYKSAMSSMTGKYIRACKKTFSNALDGYQHDDITESQLDSLLDHCDHLIMDVQRAMSELKQTKERVCKAPRGTVVVV